MKSIVLQDYIYRGLKMIDYQEFICAGKSNRIKILINSEAKWKKTYRENTANKYKNIAEEKNGFHLEIYSQNNKYILERCTYFKAE